MATSINLTVEVDSSQFDAFIAKYKAFSGQITDLNNKFAKINTTIKEANKSASLMTATMQAWEFGTKKLHGALGKITTEFLKWGTIIGGITTLLGFGGGLYGIDRLAQRVMDRRRQAMGLGTTTGGLQGASIGLSGMVDDPAGLLGRIRSGLGGSEGEQRGLTSLGVNLFGPGRETDPEKLLPEIMRKTADLLKNVPESQYLAYAESLGLTRLFSEADLTRLKNAKPGGGKGGLDETIADMVELVGKLKLDEKTTTAWQQLNIQLKIAKAEIENAFIKGLAPLTPSLKTLSDSFVTLVKALMDSGLVARLINFASRKLEELATYLKSEDFKKALKNWMIEVEGWLPTLKGLGEELKRFWDFLKELNEKGPNKTVQDAIKKLVAPRELGPSGELRPIDDPNTGLLSRGEPYKKTAPSFWNLGDLPWARQPGESYTDWISRGARNLFHLHRGNTSTQGGSTSIGGATGSTAIGGSGGASLNTLQNNINRLNSTGGGMLRVGPQTSIGGAGGSVASSSSVGGTGSMFAPGGSSRFNATARGPEIDVRGGTATNLGKAGNLNLGGAITGGVNMSTGAPSSSAAINRSSMNLMGGSNTNQSNAMTAWGPGVQKAEPPRGGGANLAFNLVGYQGGVTNFGTRGSPVDLNTYQSSRTTNLVVRNVPGSNMAMSAAGMSG